MQGLWTADLHLGHANICRYCRRPGLRDADLDEDGYWVSPEAALACAQRMSLGLIRNIKSRVVDPDSTIRHVGDFCAKGRERGVEGCRYTPAFWLHMMPGRWVFFRGNHDDNNGLKHALESAIVRLGNYTALVQHRPLSGGLCAGVDFIVCGHVHNAWSEAWIDGVLHINVGVDVRKYAPITDSELIGIASRLLKKGPPK